VAQGQRRSFAVVPDDAKEVRGRAIVIDPLALLAWMSPEILIQRLHHETDSLDDGTGIDAATRKATLAQLEAELLTAERAREHWVMEMEKGGQGGFRSRGADPVAVLGLEVIA
jgi:hypothetical protein